MSEQKVIIALKVYEKQLKDLKDLRPVDRVDPALQLAEHVTNLYIHEIALHNNQSPADFQPPFSTEAFAKSGKQDVMGTAHISALCECLSATHGILDTILGVPLDTLLTLPVIFCVRAIYAIVCLMKMWVAVSSPGDMSTVIKKEELKIESYTARLVKMFNAIVASDAQSPHGKFYYVARRLQDKFVQIREGTAKGDMGVQEEQRSMAAATPDFKVRQSHPGLNAAPATSLQLLSEAAIGSSNSMQTSHPQQGMQTRSQQPQQQIQQTSEPWYNAAGMANSQTPDMMGLGSNFDLDFPLLPDFVNISDADLSSYFMPDGELWSSDMTFQSFNGGF